MSAPLVSILIPCHNAGAWVGQSIESALGQTHEPKEVVVIDDGSTDNSRDVIAKYADYIDFYFQDNVGSNPTRNRLLERSKGEWIQYLDADDYLLPNKISEQLSAVKGKNSIDVLYGAVIVEHHSLDGVRNVVSRLNPPHDPWTELATWRLGQTGALLFRRQALVEAGGWRDNQSCCQEYELYLRLLTAGKGFQYTEGAAAVYRRFESGTLSTDNRARVWKERLRIEERLEHHLHIQGTMTPVRQNAINQARFEIARDAWNEDRPIAQAAHAAIVKTGAPFQPSGEAGPRSYRAIYRLLGFEGAERIATATRALRKKLT